MALSKRLQRTETVRRLNVITGDLPPQAHQKGSAGQGDCIDGYTVKTSHAL